MEKRTFAMIKPDAVACHYTGQIITLLLLSMYFVEEE